MSDQERSATLQLAPTEFDIFQPCPPMDPNGTSYLNHLLLHAELKNFSRTTNAAAPVLPFAANGAFSAKQSDLSSFFRQQLGLPSIASNVSHNYLSQTGNHVVSPPPPPPQPHNFLTCSSSTSALGGKLCSELPQLRADSSLYVALHQQQKQQSRPYPFSQNRFQ